MAALLAGIPVSAFQVAANGDLANWHTGAPGSIPAVGGGMDLAIGAKNTYVMMTLFAKDGSPKLVPICTYPLTGLACVSRVYTGHATFEITEDGVTVLETFGMTVDQLADRLAVTLR
jgi:3-oxoadipate CoA-transferase beta subunit